MAEKKVSRRGEAQEFPIKRSLLCGVISSGLFFVLIFLFAFAELSIGLGVRFYMPIGLILGALTAFAGGFAVLRKIREKAFQYGSLTGFLQAFICGVILFIINGLKGGTGIFIMFAVLVASSVIGAVVSANMKVRNRY